MMSLEDVLKAAENAIIESKQTHLYEINLCVYACCNHPFKRVSFRFGIFL
jgi:iron only hydrogenase large subunit-like protein